MGQGDRVLDRAWSRFTTSDRLPITDTGALIDEIEQIWGQTLLSADYKAFWVDTILEHPRRSLTKEEFLTLFRMLFEVEFQDLFDSDTNITKRTDTRTVNTEALSKLSLAEQKQRLFHKISILKGTLNAQRKRSSNADRTLELELNKRLVDCYETLVQLYDETPIGLESTDPELVAVVRRQEELLVRFQRKLRRTAKIKLWKRYLWIIVTLATVFAITSYVLGLLADLPASTDDDLVPNGYRRLPNRFFDSLNPLDMVIYSIFEWLGYV
ncbi:hypothetical protein OGAPHI_002358 [Ogataea philodendri]|uniref:Uncharacterized protein n=1 Tax=Ogataea philodendri TaxID=1378263 RepID=A0A9P8PBU4_9ASCO|nr:uncharacterized protein OGAPHI_002358 [Ogataea philodendri]KAH3668604.1 hypothetical protein OGAPHI_002358 [Ogataea philodendri]